MGVLYGLSAAYKLQLGRMTTKANIGSFMAVLPLAFRGRALFQVSNVLFSHDETPVKASSDP